MSEWQPIETAPKDGTVIDIGGLDHTGSWRRWCDARWTGGASWEGWQGPWSDGFESSIPGGTFKPTHWMPVPDPPRFTG